MQGNKVETPLLASQQFPTFPGLSVQTSGRGEYFQSIRFVGADGETKLVLSGKIKAAVLAEPPAVAAPVAAPVAEAAAESQS